MSQIPMAEPARRRRSARGAQGDARRRRRRQRGDGPRRRRGWRRRASAPRHLRSGPARRKPAEAPEPPEPAEPEPAKVCKPVKKNLKEKVQCACGRWMSQHTYKYQHKCKAQTVDEASAPKPESVPPEAPEVLPPAKPPKLKRAVQELSLIHI